MEETRFWQFIGEVNWLERHRQSRFELIPLKLELIAKYSKAENKELLDIYFAKCEDIRQLLKDYGIHRQLGIDISDAVAYAIALGRDFYEAVAEDPDILLTQKGVTEQRQSFFYVIHDAFHRNIIEDEWYLSNSGKYIMEDFIIPMERNKLIQTLDIDIWMILVMAAKDLIARRYDCLPDSDVILVALRKISESVNLIQAKMPLK